MGGGYARHLGRIPIVVIAGRAGDFELTKCVQNRSHMQLRAGRRTFYRVSASRTSSAFKMETIPFSTQLGIEWDLWENRTTRLADVLKTSVFLTRHGSAICVNGQSWRHDAQTGGISERDIHSGVKPCNALIKTGPPLCVMRWRWHWKITSHRRWVAYGQLAGIGQFNALRKEGTPLLGGNEW